MNGAVLVLNQDYRALSVASVERAVILVYLQKAEMVAAKADRFIHSVSTSIPWPSVVRLKRYVRVPYRKVMLTRRNVLRRDGHRCQYCGTSENLTIDHVIPRAQGGRDTWENLVAACVPCNHRKGSRTPDQAGMPLAKKPFRPSHVMYMRDYVGGAEEAWKPYLFAS